ncbi:MAG TPA: HEAT repeat domain-containing protein [Gaiellaceae bacterium]|nr:HEAT repeat domain-containing protein [Gaiellaceae bacterium]
MIPTAVILGATLALFVLWLALAAWVIGSRLRHDANIRLRRRDARWLARGGDVRDWSRRRLRRAADGAHSEGAADAARELVRRSGPRLLRQAKRSSQRRAHALRVLTRGGSRQAFDLLRDAYEDGASEVRAAVVAITAEQIAPAADDLLLEILVSGDHPRSRTATELTPRARGIVPKLLTLSADDDPEVRYWALMLLRDAADDERVKRAAVEASIDSSGTVRAAAARVLGASGAAGVEHALHSLLADDVFFVRSHAARAVGEIRAQPLADDVAALLADTSWWVRAAAKESLFMLGECGLHAAMQMLDNADGFARDSAREVVSSFRRETRPLELVG